MSYRYGDVVAPYLVVNEPLAIEDEHFVDCALTGLRPNTDGHNGLGVVEVLEAAQVVLADPPGGAPLRDPGCRTVPAGLSIPRQAMPTAGERVR